MPSSSLILAVVLSLMANGASADNFRCVSLDYPPLIQQEAGTPVHGLAVDIVRATFARMGHTVSVEILPWERALMLVRQGQRDCVFTIFHTEERSRFLDFSKMSLIPQIIYFYARDDHSFNFDGDFKILAQHPIGTVFGVKYGPKFEAARHTLAIREVTTLEQNFRKLMLGRVELVPSNLYTASYTLGKLAGLDTAGRIVRLPQAIDSVPSLIAFSSAKHLGSVRDIFDVELNALIASGEYRRILERYHIEWTPELARFIEAKCVHIGAVAPWCRM